MNAERGKKRISRAEILLAVLAVLFGGGGVIQYRSAASVEETVRSNTTVMQDLRTTVGELDVTVSVLNERVAAVIKRVEGMEALGLRVAKLEQDIAALIARLPSEFPPAGFRDEVRTGIREIESRLRELEKQR